MTESTSRPRSFVEALVGEQNVRTQEKVQQIALRTAEVEAKNKRIQSHLGTVFYLFIFVACIFGLAMGCLAMWNAVVG